MNVETLTIDGLAFDVRRSERRSTLEVSVGRHGELRVYAPSCTPADELGTWVRRKLLWVHQKLALKRDAIAQGSPPDFVTGEMFSYLGRSYRLKVVDKQPRALDFDGDSFLLRRDAREEAEQHFRVWYRQNGLPWIEQRVKLLAPRIGASPTEVVVRDLAYRWGSTRRNGGVSFHWKLLQLPVRLVDYVIVHELAHLVEPHHGASFWEWVERAMPDWRERKAQLDEKGIGYLNLEAATKSPRQGR